MQGLSQGSYYTRHSKTSKSGLIFRTENDESKRFVTNKLNGVFQIAFRLKPIIGRVRQL